jgi:subtilisin-like proprotein convertase family protein
MKHTLLTLSALLLIAVTISGQSLFQPIQKEQVYFDNQQLFEPEAYDAYQVEESLLTGAISKAVEQSGRITLPLPDGRSGQFQLSFYSISGTEFYEKYPEIKTFKLRQVNGDFTGYGDITGHGFHAVLQNGSEHIYIDPTNKVRGQSTYAVYHTADYQRPAAYEQFECGTEDLMDEPEEPGKTISSALERGQAMASSAQENVPLRRYRMAPITTYEYSSFHGGTLPLVTGALTTMIIRVNEVTRREFSVEYEFIDEIDSLIVLDPNNDELTDGNTEALINEAPTFIATRGISGRSYDIGHVFCTNAGGLAQLSSVCSNSGKARGVSCGFNPVGDSWYVGLVCHELGHQMGAPHSFNFCRGNNESLAFGFEPGSGTTIMSYGGICGIRNIKNGKDGYYNIGSVETIIGHMHNGPGNNCAEIIPKDHTLPEIDLPFDEDSNLAIPISTPFELEANATIEGDSDLLYCWEQRDAGLTNCEPGEPTGNCPLFRSYPPTTENKRVFPKIEDIIFNQSSIWEVLPDYSRRMRFSCTVRDWNPEGGVIAWDYVSMDVVESAGPFVVEPISGMYEVGDPLSIEWDVAGTDEAPVNCSTVDIFLSTDGGFTYPHLLQAGVPNTGSYLLNLPDIQTNSARIKVKASENVFFNISGSTFSITDATEPGFIARVSPAVQQACPPDISSYLLSTEGYGNFDSEINVVGITNLPPEASFFTEPNTVNPGEMLEVNIDFGATGTGIKDLEILLTAMDADTIVVPVRAIVVSNDFEDLIPTLPIANAENVPEKASFEWDDVQDADFYRIDIAESPDFNSSSILLSEAVGDVNEYTVDNLLPPNTLLYWRVVPVNSCGEGAPSPTSVFHTVRLQCETYISVDIPKTISAAGNGKTSSRLEIFEDGVIADLNVVNLRGTHPFIGDLTAELEGPNGEIATLFENRCFNSSDFNVTLDDEASNPILCPLNQNRENRPKDSLVLFNNQSLEGNWTINIFDRTPGTTGQLQGWGLEVCGSISVEKPEFSKDTIYVSRGGDQFIRPQNMQAQKAGNSSGDLLYTVVEAPKNGVIRHGQFDIEPGSQFIQFAIDSYHLIYEHNGSDEDLDFFSFVLTDKDGGWYGLDTVYIKVDEVLSTDQKIDQNVSVFPNPARDRFNISIPSRPTSGIYQLYNIQGQLILEKPLNGKLIYTVDAYDIPKGMYYIQLQDGNRRQTQKVIIQ